MTDTVGLSLQQRLVTLSGQLSSFAASWERTVSDDRDDTSHTSDFVQSYVDKFSSYFETVHTELQQRGLDDPLFRFQPEIISADHLRAVADRLADIAASL